MYYIPATIKKIKTYKHTYSSIFVLCIAVLFTHNGMIGDKIWKLIIKTDIKVSDNWL